MNRLPEKTLNTKSRGHSSTELLDEAMTNCEYLTYNIIFLRDSFKKIRPLLKKWDKARQEDGTPSSNGPGVKETDLQFIIKEAPQALESCYNGLNKMWGVFVALNQALRSESHVEGSGFIPETMKPDDALPTGEEETHARR